VEFLHDPFDNAGNGGSRGRSFRDSGHDLPLLGLGGARSTGRAGWNAGLGTGTVAQADSLCYSHDTPQRSQPVQGSHALVDLTLDLGDFFGEGGGLVAALGELALLAGRGEIVAKIDFQWLNADTSDGNLYMQPIADVHREHSFLAAMRCGGNEDVTLQGF
jgi:hypothetical protein